MKERTFCILLVAAFSATLGLGVISPFLPEFAKQHGANGFWIGMIFAGFGISRGLIMPLVGRVSDKTGRKIFVSSGLFLFAAISQFYPHADSVFSLTLVRMVHGLAVGLIIPIVMAYTGEIAEEGKVGLRTGKLNMMFYLGLATGPFLGGFLSQNYGFDAVFHVMSVLAVITFLMVVFFLPESRPEEHTNDVEIITFRELIRFNFIKAVLIGAASITLMMAVFLSFLPSFADRINIDPDHIGIIISVGIFLAGMLQIPFGKISDKHSTFGKLLQVGTGISIGMFALFVIPLCPDFTALLISGSFLGLGAAVAAPALANLSVTIGQRVGMGAWMGIFYAATSIGFVITPLLAGIIMDHLGIDAVFYLFGVFSLFGIFWVGHFVYMRHLGYKAG